MKKHMLKGIILCLGFIFMFSLAFDCHAAKFMNVTAQVKNKTKVEISWKKKSVAGYEIYRASSNKNGKTGKYKKIATVSGSKTKYIDKKVKYKKYYSYKVKAYKKKNGKNVTKYQGYADVYTGMAKPDWEDCLYADAETTPSSIQLIGYTDGLQPSGFEIYRKTGSSKYKKIKTVKSKKGYFAYVDKTVEKGKKYTYKYRSYRKLNKKKIYSKYSDPVKLTAVNRDAVYTMENFTEERLTKVITVKLTSGEGNGNTYFRCLPDEISYTYHQTPDGDGIYVTLQPVRYSYDNVTWNTFPANGIHLAENQFIYLQFEAVDMDEAFEFTTFNTYHAEIEWYLEYNDREAILCIDFVNSTANIRINGEYYH